MFSTAFRRASTAARPVLLYRGRANPPKPIVKSGTPVQITSSIARKRTESGIVASLASRAGWPIVVCLLGDFRVLKVGRLAMIPHGGKAETLLRMLALGPQYTVRREAVLCALWPDSTTTTATHSLNTLVHSIHKLLGDAIGDAQPVLHMGGSYGLNAQAGVGVDVALFDDLVRAGNYHTRTGRYSDAMKRYSDASKVYGGDLCGGVDLESVVERERLRAVYLTVLARLADASYAEGKYAVALQNSVHLLARDPCREDGHRMAMRCYVRLGERAQALRQYRICEQILRSEFDAAPESSTKELFDQIRFDPARI